jgi:hypothetical protein
MFRIRIIYKGEPGKLVFAKRTQFFRAESAAFMDVGAQRSAETRPLLQRASRILSGEDDMKREQPARKYFHASCFAVPAHSVSKARHTAKRRRSMLLCPTSRESVLVPGHGRRGC